MGYDGHRGMSFPDRLKSPWVAAGLTTTVLLAATWVLLLGDGAVGRASEPTAPLSPSGAEVAYSVGYAVMLFLALWAFFWLIARSKSRTRRAGA